MLYLFHFVQKLVLAQKNKSLFNLVNIYRPPKDQNDKYSEFTKEISSIMTSSDKERSECIIAVDFNLDLLRLIEREVFGEFLDALIENSFYPNITLPTRFSIKRSTVIDKFIAN